MIYHVETVALTFTGIPQFGPVVGDGSQKIEQQ